MQRSFQMVLVTGAIALAAVVAGCGSGSKGNARAVSEPTGPIVATIPHGASLHDVGLSSLKWSLTPNFHLGVTRPKANPTFEYVGTGKPNGNDAATLNVPIRPGTIYMFSAYVDPSNLVSGDFDLFIDTRDGTSSYALVYHAKGKPSRFTTTPWLAPQGVTHAKLGMQIVGATIKLGKKLSFSAPVLSNAVLGPKPQGR